MHFGQAQVEDQQVEFGVGHQRGVGLSAAGHMVYRGTRTAQRPQQAISQDLVVFGNQNPHVCSSCFLHSRPRRARQRPAQRRSMGVVIRY